MLTLSKKSYILLRFFLQKLKQDCVSAYAAQAAFYIMLSFFPFCMFLLTMIQYLPSGESDLTILISQTATDAIAPFILNIVDEIYESTTMTIVSVTAVTTLWAASKAFYSLIYGLNSVYNIPENRNYLYLRFRATIYTVIFAVMLLATLLLLAFGNSIAYAIKTTFPTLKDAAVLVISIRASAAMCILVLFFLYLYVLIPNHKSRISNELPGAVLTAAGWLGFSFLYSFYIDHMGNFSKTYGSLTAIILLMLWLYACMYMLLMGGAINDCLRGFSISQKIRKS